MAKPPKSAGHRQWGKHARSEVLGHGVRVRRLPRRPADDDAGHPRDPAVFAVNLKGLSRLAGMTPSEVAARSGVARRWYVRLMGHGLARIDRRTRAGLERLAHLFGLKGVGDFWDPCLDRLRPRPGVDEQVLSWSTRVNWPYAKKLLELLETGEHEHLKGLIDSLHALEVRKGLGDARAASGSEAPEVQAGTGSLRHRLGGRARRAD